MSKQSQLTEVMVKRNLEGKTRVRRRREKLRRLLSTRQGVNGIDRLDELAEILGVSIITCREDVRALGAVKISAKHDGRVYHWWTLPVWNPSAEHMRYIDKEIVDNTIARKVSEHVVEAFVHNNIVFVNCERGAGPLLFEWVTLATWEGMVFVQEQRSSIIIHCTDVAAASAIHHRLLGKDVFDEKLETE